MRRTAPLWMWALVALQVLCAAIFVSEFVSEVLGLRDWALPFAWRELLQVLAALGLMSGAVAATALLVQTRRRLSHANAALRAASDAFFDVVQSQFENWALSRSERDVALLMLRGYDNDAIADILGKGRATVKTQVGAIFRKAGLTHRHQLLSHFVDDLLSAGHSPFSAAQPAGKAQEQAVLVSAANRP